MIQESSKDSRKCRGFTGFSKWVVVPKVPVRLQRIDQDSKNHDNITKIFLGTQKLNNFR